MVIQDNAMDQKEPDTAVKIYAPNGGPMIRAILKIPCSTPISVPCSEESTIPVVWVVMEVARM